MMRLSRALPRAGLVILGLLLAGLAQATTYTFRNVSSVPSPSTPAICSGNWSKSGSTFTCGGNLSLAAGDVLEVSTGFFEILDDITVVATGNISLTGNSIGTSAKNINLQTTAGTLTATDSTISGWLRGTKTISLNGGSVSGNVRSDGAITTNGTDLSAGVRSDSSSIGITGGTIAGVFYASNKPASFSGVTMTSGSVSSAGTVTFTNSALGSAESKVSVTSVSGAVTLNNSIAFGDFTAPNSSTIYVNSPSSVTGTCLPNSTPANACNPNLTPVCFSDSFNGGSLSSDDWVVTSRSGTFGTPRIVNNRLRLTDNSTDVATAATLQRLLPANNNYVQVQFAFNAYGGNGADGVAVVFSDASITPQSGAFGGPLGYGTKNTAATTGFAGGWLGVGLDEYGNFSNEGGPGSIGTYPDAVAMRGSGAGTSGYRYLTGSGTLSTGIDISGSSPGPGHIYRITLDSTVPGKTLARVERKIGSGSFTTLIPSFDVRGASGQAPIPNDFYLSLTGSTGSSYNIHELDNLQVCASRMNPVGAQIDHFELGYSSTALTCNPQPISIRACLNSSCSSLYTDPVSVTLSPAGHWTALAPALVNGNTISFTGGSAQARLSIATAATINLGVLSSLPSAKAYSATVCSSSACQIDYVDSALLLQVPNMLAAKPTKATISAVRKADNALQCVPAFANVNRKISFTSAYVDPASGSKLVKLNNVNLPASLDLDFDETGTAPLTVQYDDAGQMRLSATYSGSSGSADPGLSLTGADLFVSKPYGLCLAASATCSTADISCVAASARAGDSFPLTIKAVAWTKDGQALNASQLCDNSVTPNFRHAAIGLSSTVQAPAGGSNGSMSPNTYSHALGNQTTANTSVSEVGIFSLTATPPAGGYLDGETVSGGTLDRVGRFIPAYLSPVFSAALTPACGTFFSYQGQPISFAANGTPQLTVSAYNRAKAQTKNYDRGDFWRLGLPTRDAYISVIANRAGLNARLASSGTVSTTTSDPLAGDGSKVYGWSGEQLLYNPPTPPLVPSGEDYPVAANVRQGFSAQQLTDADGACYLGSDGACSAYSVDFGGSEVRLGRLRIGNASGSELQSLSLPLVLESWQATAGGSFQLEQQDSCTALGAATLDSYTGHLASGETLSTLGTFALGQAGLALSAPGSGNDGSLQVSFPNAPAWLQYPWNGTSRQAARGLAVFGTYQGAAPLIYRREVYR